MAPLSMRFSRQKHWSGLLFTFPGSLPHAGIEPVSLGLQAGSLPQSHQGSPTVTLTEKSLSIKWLMNWTAGGSNASCRDRQLKWRLPLLWQSSSGGTGLVKHLINFIISILIKRQPSREGREQGGFAVRDRGRTPGLPMAWLLAMEWNV